MRTVLGDWEVTAIVGAGTGQPLTVFSGNVPGLNGGPSGTGFDANQVANRVANVSCRAESGPSEQIINPSAYTLDGFQIGTLGSARRGDCTGPGYFQTDLAFYKNFPLKNGVKFQFRWDIFNIFNNTNFLFQNLTSSWIRQPQPSMPPARKSSVPRFRRVSVKRLARAIRARCR